MWINPGFYTPYAPGFFQYEVNINFRLTGCYPPESLYFLPEINSPKLSSHEMGISYRKFKQ